MILDLYRTNFPANIPHVSIFLNVFFTDKFKKFDITFDGMTTVRRSKLNVAPELMLVDLQIINNCNLHLIHHNISTYSSIGESASGYFIWSIPEGCTIVMSLGAVGLKSFGISS